MNNKLAVLKFASVRKAFGDVVALDDFNLEVAAGELVTLLGPSGCGKTTALRIAAGFERGDGGSVELNGIEISGLPAHKRNMGMVFQNYSLFPHMNVSENIGFGLKVRGRESSESEKAILAVLDRVRLTGLQNRYPHQLSGGQQQRVALARALVFEPQVLLLDEPLSALDAKVRAELRDEIRLLQSEIGVATIFVTHDQDEALSISDRICVIKDGQVQQVGTPRDIYFQPANNFVARFVGAMNELPSVLIGKLGKGTMAMLRPDAVSICALGESGSIGATVIGQHFGGSTTLLRLRLDHEDVLISALTISGSASVAIDERVGVRFDSDKATEVQS